MGLWEKILAASQVLGRSLIDDHGKKSVDRESFLTKLYSQSWSNLFAFVFSPYIWLYRLICSLRWIRNETDVHKMAVLLLGMAFSILAGYLINTWIGSVSSFIAIGEWFGYLYAIAFLFGSGVSDWFSFILTGIVINTCLFITVKLSSPKVIESALKDAADGSEKTELTNSKG